ncbi:hypothetical protein [Methanobrevibacter filiformis]|uniref:TM2 domain protein n=1 Tax=Methanobrevibacter filiformis TaxID=55758 RepID=A0A166CDY5_9EURY|nr:hypothetical protein [Methanobrevibacter filiformis]KZX14406.1 hypothetical protein MBFIL_08810 [Methanobrevibacter filiformis]
MNTKTLKNKMTRGKILTQTANPILAAILSLVIPGLGQLYGGEGVKKAIIFLVIFIVLGALTAAVSPYVGTVSFIFAVYAAYDAYKNVKG